jgi:hypothetical protein
MIIESTSTFPRVSRSSRTLGETPPTRSESDKPVALEALTVSKRSVTIEMMTMSKPDEDIEWYLTKMTFGAPEKLEQKESHGDPGAGAPSLAKKTRGEKITVQGARADTTLGNGETKTTTETEIRAEVEIEIGTTKGIPTTLVGGKGVETGDKLSGSTQRSQVQSRAWLIVLLPTIKYPI